ncbi:MAG: MerR family transcriptional regulator [Chloroflexia bacterium]
MFKIGDFARLTRLSVKTLRYYDEIGLLCAARIDRFTGYRYYTADQLPRLNRILALRDLGLSLDRIALLLDTDLPIEQIRTMLTLRRAELLQAMETAQTQLARVEARLRQIDEEGKMSNYEVVLKPVGAVRVAGLEGVIPNEEAITPTFNRLFDGVTDYVVKHGGKMNGPGIALWHDALQPDHDMRVAAALPLQGNLPEGDGVRVHELPAAMMACTVHHGSFDGLSSAYNTLMGWIEANGYRVAGPNREVYLQYERDGDPSKYVTEVQFPVEKP